MSSDERVRLDVFQNRIENLATVIIPSCINQLDQQRKNIRYYQEEEEWEVMRKEQRNASRTVKVSCPLCTLQGPLIQDFESFFDNYTPLVWCCFNLAYQWVWLAICL